MSKKLLPPSILTEKGLSLFKHDLTFRDLELPIVEIETESLLWHLDMPVWEKDNTDDWNLTPREVLNKEKFTRNHQKKIAEVDLSFPILVTMYKERLVILDGIHRLCKAYSNKNETIKAKIIPSELLEVRY
ncbi:MAG: hypothetical protein WD049_03005 [Candidatus Paceibacterota bacterium]